MLFDSNTMNRNVETNRLLIRPLELKDTDFILELVNSKGWLQYIGDRNVRDNESASQYIRKILNTRNFYYNVIEIKETNLPIGIVSFLHRENHQFPDIGFALLPDHEKMGFAFEAAKNYLDEIKKEARSEKVIAITKPDNMRSISLLNKLGLEFESTYIDNAEQLDIYSINFRK